MSDPITAGAILKVASTGSSVARMVLSIATGFKNYKEKKETEWWESVVRNFQAQSNKLSQEEVESRLHDLAARENALKAMSLSWRYLLESVDDSVLPALACITAEYLASEQLPDAFYRGVCRTLSDLSHKEFVDLQQLCTELVGVCKPMEDNCIALKQICIRRESETGNLEARGVGENGAPTTAQNKPWVESYGRLLKVLETYGIGSSSPAWGGSLTSLTPETLRHLDKIINPQW